MTEGVQNGSPTPFLEWAVAAQPAHGEVESGDQYLVKPFPGGVLVAAIDALGHGAHAAAVARVVVSVLEDYAPEPVQSLMVRCHQKLRGTRGAVMSLASFDIRAGTMTWLGLGNIEGLLLRSNGATSRTRERLMLRGGVLGYNLSALRPAAISVVRKDTLVFATDGLRSNFSDRLLAGSLLYTQIATGTANGQSVLDEDPQQSANQILSEYSRGTDDALVVIARYIGGTV